MKTNPATPNAITVPLRRFFHMVNIEHYITSLTELLCQRFGTRLLYIGLQGSYLRGEATDRSDIDMMVIIDSLSMADLNIYRDTISSLPHFEQSCGFICSKEDLAKWNPLEICHLLHSTKDYYGKLRTLVPVFTEHDIRNFVKLSVGNLYHEICHRYIHAGTEASKARLPGTFKGVFFILQNLHYLTHGEFIGTKAELVQLLSGKDQAVLEHSIAMNQGAEFDFEESFQLLFTWCQETLQSI